MEGYLKKWINLIYRWQNRYFIIHDGVLMYCIGKDKPKKGQVHLSICSIRTVSNDPCRIVINYGMNEMHLRASSVYEQEKWLRALLEEQEKVKNSAKKNNLLSDKIDNFAMLEDAPMVNLSKIHTTLTKLWVAQAQLEETLCMMNSKESQKLCSITQDIKQIATEMGQQVDEEYKKLVDISQKLQNKIRETNDNNPPDADEAEEELIENQNNNTLFQSFQSFDDSEFQSILDEYVHDERQLDKPVHRRKQSNKISFIRQSSFIPIDSKSIMDLLERIKTKQPIKYNNMITNDAWKDMSLGTEPTRDRLPAFKDPNEKVRLFSVIKDMIGKDLTKIAFPVTFNEPLSMLQNFAELFQHSEILDEANKLNDSTQRLAYVSVFVLSSLSSTINRIKKPFNPLLGETFEFVCPKFRFLSEQVSHHPPISAAHCENDHFEYYGDNSVKTQFFGKSIEFTPQSVQHIILKNSKDHYVFTRPKSSLKNLIFGEQYLENYGEMQVKNANTQDVAIITLHERGWTGSNAYEVTGQVKNGQGRVDYKIKGKWDSKIDVINAQTNESKCVWQRSQLPVNSDQQYFFTWMAIQLNHLNQQMLHELPPTDSRLRPDQRALENMNIEIATIEKARLEQKQRGKKKELQNAGQEHVCRWFNKELDGISKQQCYLFNKSYWRMKNTNEFHQSNSDIF